MSEQTEYLLTDREKEYVLALQHQIDHVTAPLVSAMRGALELIVRQQALPGNWSLSEDKTKLIRQE